MSDKQPIPRMTDEEMRRMSLFTQPVNPNPLATLEADIREHWDEFLPARVAALKAAGTYETAVAEAVAQTEAEYDEEVANGMHPLAAWEAVRQRYAFLPAEPGAGEDGDDLWVDDESEDDDEDDGEAAGE